MKNLNTNQRGFTLVELLIVVAVLGFALTGMMQILIQSSILADSTGNETIALAEAQGKIEEIRNHTYDSIVTDYASGGAQGNTFNLVNATGKGLVTINNSNPELLTISVTVAWLNKDGRVIGEDTDRDGVLDAGEDANGNGALDSPVKLMSMVTRR